MMFLFLKLGKLKFSSLSLILLCALGHLINPHNLMLCSISIWMFASLVSDSGHKYDANHSVSCNITVHFWVRRLIDPSSPLKRYNIYGGKTTFCTHGYLFFFAL